MEIEAQETRFSGSDCSVQVVFLDTRRRSRRRRDARGHRRTSWTAPSSTRLSKAAAAGLPAGVLEQRAVAIDRAPPCSPSRVESCTAAKRDGEFG
ncbi:hypothetical protein ACP70R_002788 [Stipagrostis hirtigluma subsp. patula]